MAKQSNKPEQAPAAKVEARYVIASPFIDKFSKQSYAVDQPANFEASRLADLIGLGLVKQL